MNELASRKQLLIAESELNRANLSCEWRSLTGEVHALGQRAETIGSMVKAAATLISGLASLRNSQSPPADQKFSWWRAALKGAGMANVFWSEIRAKNREK